MFQWLEDWVSKKAGQVGDWIAGKAEQAVEKAIGGEMTSSLGALSGSDAPAAKGAVESQDSGPKDTSLLGRLGSWLGLGGNKSATPEANEKSGGDTSILGGLLGRMFGGSKSSSASESQEGGGGLFGGLLGGISSILGMFVKALVGIFMLVLGGGIFGGGLGKSSGGQPVAKADAAKANNELALAKTAAINPLSTLNTQIAAVKAPKYPAQNVAPDAPASVPSYNPASADLPPSYAKG